MSPYLPAVAVPPAAERSRPAVGFRHGGGTQQQDGGGEGQKKGGGVNQIYTKRRYNQDYSSHFLSCDYRRLT